ncbi:MAG: hypothetical protein QXL27_09585 [Candidatus Bathyarchaeia archaeon]
MLSKFSRILEYLAIDGEWHTVEEVAEAVGQNITETSELLSKLAYFNFVEFDEKGRVRVDPDFRRLP